MRTPGAQDSKPSGYSSNPVHSALGARIRYSGHLPVKLTDQLSIQDLRANDKEVFVGHVLRGLLAPESGVVARSTWVGFPAAQFSGDTMDRASRGCITKREYFPGILRVP